MKSIKLSQELQKIQAYGQSKLADQGKNPEDVAAITRRVLKRR